MHMTILHIASVTNEKSKGPNINVPKNITYGNKYGTVGLLNINNTEKIAVEIPKNKYFTIEKYSSINKLPKPFNRPDIVVFQGLYYIKYCKIAKWLRKNNIPYIIVPRCSMTTAAIKSHSLKKKIANLLLFNKLIANADSIQFLTNNEYQESKNNFKFKDFFIIGNGFETPNKHYSVKDRNRFKIVFIGRYNIYHKGLDILLKAINNHIGWFKDNNISIELYGSDSDNGLAYLNKYINERNLKEIVHINGPVYDKDKEKALLDADIFIHTSRLEGQPTSVIEAISYGIPLIVTPGTNVADIVKKNKLGITTDLNAEAIFNSIQNIYARKNEYSIISNNEIKFAKENLDWNSITIKLINKCNEIMEK